MIADSNAMQPGLQFQRERSRSSQPTVDPYLCSVGKLDLIIIHERGMDLDRPTRSGVVCVIRYSSHRDLLVIRAPRCLSATGLHLSPCDERDQQDASQRQEHPLLLKI